MINNTSDKVEVKKSYKADLEHHRLPAFLLGLVVVLTLFLVALEYTTHPDDGNSGDSLMDDMAQDIEMMPAMQQKDMIAAAPTAAAKGATPKINKVDHETIETEADKLGNNPDATTNSNGNNVNGNAEAAADDDSNQTTALSPVAVDEDDNVLNLRVVQKLPEFPGGMVEFMKWLTKNLQYPELAKQQNIKGKVVVAFIINKDGSISNCKVTTSVSPELDREALRILRIMPKWKPGEEHGKPCRTYFAIPINFML